jgi:hypothetical protein
MYCQLSIRPFIFTTMLTALLDLCLSVNSPSFILYSHQMHRFYQELTPLFALPRPRFWLLRWIPGWQQFIKRWALAGILTRLITPKEVIQNITGSPDGGSPFSASGIGANVSSEFESIKRDILDILNPDIDAIHKLEHIGRMKTSYSFLVARA